MPSYATRALVLRKTKLGETDVILTLLADDGRQIRAVAKGMRKPGSRFCGRMEPFCVVDLLLHSGRSLDVVTEVRSVCTNAPLREDFDRSSAASVVVDLLDKLAQEGQSEERLFGLGEATMVAMAGVPASQETTLAALVCGFLVKAMAIHGLRPELGSCAACAGTHEGGHSFSLDSGGVLCPECGNADLSALPFTENGLELVSALLRMTMAQIAESDPDPGAVRETLHVLRAFVRYHIPARLKALEMYSMEGM